MADRSAQVRRVAARLRGRGFKVVEVDGWQNRGKGPMVTSGRMEHHTASPRGSSDTASLRVVTFGRDGLRNSLCRWYVSRSGVIYLVALHKSWHAGSGTKGTNSTLSGTESEHSGTSSERWSAASLDAQAAISQEEAAEFGFPTEQVWDHKEHAGHRGKIDRISIDPDQWRARLAEKEDVMAVADWAKDAWNWARSKGIMSEHSVPGEVVTKQELAVFLQRYHDRADKAGSSGPHDHDARYVRRGRSYQIG